MDPQQAGHAHCLTRSTRHLENASRTGGVRTSTTATGPPPGSQAGQGLSRRLGTARELLADFREVEKNFRKLDRQLREKIAGWHGARVRRISFAVIEKAVADS
jgi:Protein of unknown function (DUF3375)